MAPVVAVACGVLRRGNEVLIAQRPVGKVAAGKWEFPGGKIESGEESRDALYRELREELGIEVSRARPLLRVCHDYSDRRVLLDTWLVSAWRGELHGHDNQRLAWSKIPELRRYDLLAADGPIVTALELPDYYVFTPPAATFDEIRAGLERLPEPALLRLRLPQLDEKHYRVMATALLPMIRERSLRLILDRDPSQVHELKADGWHASAAALASLRSRPDGLVLASCHDRTELQLARDWRVDAAVVGSVNKTATHASRQPLRWDGFRELAAIANMPVYALGGLAAADLASAHDLYAQGIAGISSFWQRQSMS